MKTLPSILFYIPRLLVRQNVDSRKVLKQSGVIGLATKIEANQNLSEFWSASENLSYFVSSPAIALRTILRSYFKPSFFLISLGSASL